MREALGEAIARLPEREKLVITLYYYEELTLREIGEVLGVTESRVSQLHTKAILRLKARLAGTAAARVAADRDPRRAIGSVRHRPRSLARMPAQEPGKIRNVAVVGHRGPERHPSSRPCSSSPAPSTGSAPSRRARPSPTRMRTSSGGRCRCRRPSRTCEWQEPEDQPDRRPGRRRVPGRHDRRAARGRGRAVVVISGVMGVEVGTGRAWHRAEDGHSRASSSSTCSTASAPTSSARSRGCARSSPTAASPCTSRSAPSTS